MDVLLKRPPVHPPDLPLGLESQDSEQFFRKVLGPTEGSSVSGPLQPSIKPVQESDSNQSGFPQRNLLPGMGKIFRRMLYELDFSYMYTLQKNHHDLTTGASLSGALPSTGMMDSFSGLSQSPFFDIR